jgi:hypothetical protein
MQDRSSTPKNINELEASKAKNTDGEPQKEITEEATQKNPAAVILGHLGGLKGGKARAAKLSPKRRGEIARMAAKARWEKK